MEEFEHNEHYKAILRGVDITEKWYAICCYLESKETEINIPDIKIKIGEMAWEQNQEPTPIFAHKNDTKVYFTRITENGSIDIQHQLQNMYIHGDEYLFKIDKTIDTIVNILSQTDYFNEVYAYIHCCFMNGNIKNFI